MNSIFIVIPILLIFMFCLGLELSWADFALFKRQYKALLIGLSGQLIILPLVAIIITVWLPIPAVLKAGVVLIACCPGGASSNAFTMVAKGNVPLSVTLTLVSSLVTLVTLPFIMGLYLHQQAAIQIPISKLFIQNILMILTPLLIGMAWRHFKPEQAFQIARFIKKYALSLLLFLTVLFFVENQDIIRAHFVSLGTAVTLLIMVAIGVGVLLSKLFRLKRQDQRTITIEVGMQNAAQAIALAASPFVFNSSEMAVPAIIYALMMNLILLSYLGMIKRRERLTTETI